MRAQFQRKPLKKGGNVWLAIIFAMIALMGMLSIFTPASEAAASEEDVTKVGGQGTYTGYLFKVVSVTVTSVVFLVIGLWLYKKQLKIKGANSLGVNILAKHYINDKQYLLKVYVEGRYMLLGVSDSSINFITDLNDEFEDEEEDKQDFGTILDLETNEETQV